MNIEGSDAYFQIGNVGFESAIIDRIRHNNPNLKIVNVSGGIDLIYGTHSDCENDSIECQHSHEVDPHVWSSVRNCKIIAINMLNAMTEIDPTHANVYKANCSVLVNHLDSLDAQFANMLSKKPLLSFMVWHPSLSYFARDYNLKQISIGIEGKEISIQRIQEKIDEAKTYNATVFFAQKDFDSRQASIISKETGAIVVDINLLTYDWEKELYEIATTLAAE
jgi:zinc transport system substrate-binding protein